MPHEVIRKQLNEIRSKSSEWGIKDPFGNEWVNVLPEDLVRNHGFQGSLCRWIGKNLHIIINNYRFEDGHNVELYMGQCSDCGRVFWM